MTKFLWLCHSSGGNLPPSLGVAQELTRLKEAPQRQNRLEAAERERKNAAERLQQHFADHLYQYRRYPERFVVITEIILRSFRDAAVREILLKQEDLWLNVLISILQEGIAAGEFDPHLSLEVTAGHITGLLRGILLSRHRHEHEWPAVTNQLMAWIVI